MEASFSTAVLIFIAEFGDKSQLLALSFAARYSWRVTLIGVALGTALIQLVSVTVGTLLGAALPTFWIQLAAGLVFIAFGLWTLREEPDEDEHGEEEKATRAGQALARFGPLFTTMGAFFLAELGDKTMLMTMTLASQRNAFVAVWLGATLGMVLASSLGVLLGSIMGARLPERVIKVGAAAVFILFGIWTLAEAFGLDLL